MNNNFIIFLDVDGVLVSWLHFHDRDEKGEVKFNPIAVSALNAIIKYYDADLCMISSWNTKFPDAKSYKDFMLSRGIKVNDLTIGDHEYRPEYIVNMINDGLTKYLIIDDESYLYHKTKEIEYKRILTPNRYRCLDEYDGYQVTKNYFLG
jgi:hypothetical protein